MSSMKTGRWLKWGLQAVCGMLRLDSMMLRYEIGNALGKVDWAPPEVGMLLCIGTVSAALAHVC